MKLRGPVRLAVWCALAVWPPALPAAEPDPVARTVVLVNSRQAESVALGEYYLRRRGIPRANLIALPLPVAETITRREFVDRIWQPLQDELFRRGWIEGVQSRSTDAEGRRRVAATGQRLAYLVVCRGTPLRIQHEPANVDPAAAARLPEQFRTNAAAVDSELSLLAHGSPETLGIVRNPLFPGRAPGAVADAGLLLRVSRLDGPTDAAARDLVDSALAAERQGLIGRYYIDLGGPIGDGEHWLESTRAQLADLGYYGDVHPGPGLFGPADRFDAPAFYFGWYAGDVVGPFLREGFRFAPGAIALHIHSFSAASLRTADRHWCGPFVARGVAATFGNVHEPYLELTLRPDLLLRHLAAGATLGEAAYRAMPALGWQTIVIGDPLYRPFRVTLDEQVARADGLPAELAGHVVARQAALLDRLGLHEEARGRFAEGLRRHPGLALALAAARFELAHDRPAPAAAILSAVATGRDFSTADWPLARAAAALLAQLGSTREALPLYEELGRRPAPTDEARRQLLAEARRVAEAAGNARLVQEFERLSATVPPALPAIRGGN